MNRRTFLTSALAAGLIVPALPAMADSIQDDILVQLTHQGFSRVEVSRTLLGRLRFVAYSTDMRRELIVNARTGEVLRDYLQPIDESAAPSTRIANPGSRTSNDTRTSTTRDTTDSRDDSRDDSKDDSKDDKESDSSDGEKDD